MPPPARRARAGGKTLDAFQFKLGASGTREALTDQAGVAIIILDQQDPDGLPRLVGSGEMCIHESAPRGAVRASYNREPLNNIHCNRIP